MEYTERPPHTDLASLVRTYWWLSGEADPDGAADPALPDGSPELIVNLGDPWEQIAPDGSRRTQPRAFLVGQILRPMAVRPTGRIALVAVRFEAHGAALVTEEIAALTDRWVPLAALCATSPGATSPRATTLLALPRQLADAAEMDAQTTVLDDALRALMASAPPVDSLVGDAVRTIRASQGAAEIDGLARSLGVSVRTLQRRFVAATGISPKLLARIVRFQRVFAAWREEPASLSRVALESGYYDQSHLVRDFRDFAGAPPAGFLAAMPAFTAFFTAARRRG